MNAGTFPTRLKCGKGEASNSKLQTPEKPQASNLKDTLELRQVLECGTPVPLLVCAAQVVPDYLTARDTRGVRKRHRSAALQDAGARPLLPFVFLAVCLLLAITSSATVAAGSLKPVHLRCEYLVNPVGIDETAPRLTWNVESRSLERGQNQTAYQILVSSEPALLRKDVGDLWDSGRVSTNQTVNIAYSGKPLISRQRCFWKVKVWDDHDRASSWSDTGTWSMGLLRPEDWSAQYVSFKDQSTISKDTGKLVLPPAHQFRKEFVAATKIKRATIYATALGIYELHLNGKRIGDACFTPGWSDYHQRAYYNTYDVTEQMARGRNALAAWVADGWYSGYLGFGLLTGMGTEKMGRWTYGKTPTFMAQLEIEYADGSHEVISTDRSWKVTGDGPIREADLLMGEFYDARKETDGWTKAGFDDSKWEQAITAEENASVKATFYQFQELSEGKAELRGREVDLGFHRPEKLEAYPSVPVRHIQEIKPVAVTSPTNGVYIFNLGQNFAGVVRLKVKGPAGTKIRLRYGEMLHPDGRLMTENLRKARATDFYVLRGDPHGEAFTPRFTFHGFQYVELTGFPGKPGPDAITGIVMHSDTPMTSAFECSDPMVNKLFHNVIWTQRANFLDLPTDCPQRDERFGWTGDAQIYVRTATYNADVAAFYTKWLRELMESQRRDGVFPGYAPFPFQHGREFGTAWCDAGVICPYTIYKAYGDKRIIERCWDHMVAFLEWRKRTSKDFLGVDHGNPWGDWLALNEKTPLDYIDTIYFGYSTKLMEEMALAIDRPTQAAAYRELFKNIQKAFNAKYVKPDASLSVDTQTAYVLALYAGFFPQDLRAKAAQHLADKIQKNGDLMATGFLGTRAIVPVLADQGQEDAALRLLQSHKYPSWGYEVDQGATTIWERWNSYTKEKGFGGDQNASMNSFAHYSFGAICEWMFSGLAGIDTEDAGYGKISIRPVIPNPAENYDAKPISWVRARYDSIRGRIESSWKCQNGVLDFDVTIPANTTATVVIPSQNAQALTEGGRPVSQARGIEIKSESDGHVTLSVSSGAYHFHTAAPFALAQK